MANPISRTITQAGNDAPFALDWMNSPFGATIEVIVPNGVTASFSLQYTEDDLNAVPPMATFTTSSANWVPDPDVQSATATVTKELKTPHRFGRLVVGSLSGGNLLLRVVQGMSARM